MLTIRQLTEIKQTTTIYARSTNGQQYSQVSMKVIDNIDKIDKRDLKKLYPVIKKESHLNVNKMKKEVLTYIKECCNLNASQTKFIKLFEDAKYCPEYLFEDEEVIRNAITNPIANWKMELKKKM